MSRAHRLLAGLLAAGALLTVTAGCASVDPIERLGRKAAQKVTHPHPEPAAGPQARPHGDHARPGVPAATACPRLPGAGHSRWASPPEQWRPARPGADGEQRVGGGCGRR